MFRFTSCLAVLVVLAGAGDVADASGTPWRTVYQTDFSADPAWVTNNSDRYYWNSADQTYSATQVNINGGGEYGYYNAGYNGGSFRLQWDLNVLSSDYASDVGFGLFDSDMNILSGSKADISFVRHDQGYNVNLDSYDTDDTQFADIDFSAQFSHDTWYRVVMEYDADTSTLTADVTLRDTAEELTSLSVSGIGSFAPDMGRVGSGHVRPDGSYQAPGAESSAKFDNVVFSEPIPEPSTLVLLGMGAVGLLAYGLRRRKRSAGKGRKRGRKRGQGPEKGSGLFIGPRTPTRPARSYRASRTPMTGPATAPAWRRLTGHAAPGRTTTRMGEMGGAVTYFPNRDSEVSASHHASGATIARMCSSLMTIA